ncbi:MAG: SDR family NAD(P)-dependent oxidoreductase, partial [Clostridia bacterium]|nr:SDR family NAD(P)-dependent oxidoreductase [Clostridia bacterium]
MESTAFSGKRVIVTGGSRGIGAEIVRSFAREVAKVAFLYHNSVEAAQNVAKETGATPIRCDLADPYDAERAIQEAETALSGVDILVNNAG